MKIIVNLNQALKEQYDSSRSMTSMFIFLENEGEIYPSNDWVDNPEIILGWWAKTVVDLVDGNDGHGINFMEGNYEIDAKIDEQNIYLSSIDGEISWVVGVRSFIEALIDAFKKTMFFLEELGELEFKGFRMTIALLEEKLRILD